MDIRVTLSVGDAHLRRFDEVARAAEAAGLRIEQRLDGIGVLTGQIDAKALGRLRAVPGVEGVEQERRVGIAPPDSTVQ